MILGSAMAITLAAPREGPPCARASVAREIRTTTKAKTTG